MSQVHLEDCRHSSVVNLSRQKQTSKVEDSSINLRHRELLSKFGPILRLMKLTGAYYGDVSKVLEVDSSIFPRFYCAVVLLGQWFVCVQAVTSLFFEGLAQMKTFYFLMLFIICYLQSAAVNTIFIYILPKRQKQTSRLGQFINGLLSTTSNFSGMKTYKMKLAMVFVCAFCTFNTVFVVILDCYQNSSVARLRPWNGLFAYRLIQFVFFAFDCFAWAIPCPLFYISCHFLIRIFENLEKKISTCPNFLIIKELRKEHHKLCETVALADKVLSPIFLVTVILDVPLMCINFHQLVKVPLSGEDNVIYIASVLYWCITVTGRLGFIMRYGVRVNEKIHSFYDTLQNISVTDPQEHLELLRFLMHLRGEPIGLSIGGLVVLNKSFVLSLKENSVVNNKYRAFTDCPHGHCKLVGIIISYFAVLVTLPS